MSHPDCEEKSAFHISGKVTIAFIEGQPDDAPSFEERLRKARRLINFRAQGVSENAHMLYEELQSISDKKSLIYIFP